jgi:accessory gene regulator B
MIDNIIDKNIIFLQSHGVKINNDNDKAIYKYGLQILYYYIIDLSVIFSLATIFGKLYETAIMTFIFSLLQVFGGGYHAETPGRCLMTMIAGVIFGNILIELLANKIIFNILLTAVFSVFILILTPVTNKRHSICKKVKYQSKFILQITIIAS